MSSTTDRPLAETRQRGQALAVFAVSLTALLLSAALAFDGGMLMLERRDQQNAADAAAMAGARYVLSNKALAATTARTVATANGFTDGTSSQSVTVNIPPKSGLYAGQPGAIEVVIGNTRPSVFAGVMGIADWLVGARAVAVNQDGVGAGFAILSLDPSGCDAVLIAGTGVINAWGDIQVNSTCADGALRSTGSGTVWTDGGACNVVGPAPLAIDEKEPNTLLCAQYMDADVLPDPFAGLPPPPEPGLAPAVVQEVGSESIPNGCPGSSNPATEASPRACSFNGNNYRLTEWRLFPGKYPGGLNLKSGKFYLEPGVYWLDGGGLDAGGADVVVYSVDPGDTTGPAGGVLFYNTELSDSGPGQFKGIQLNSNQADIRLWPLADGSMWDGFLIFTDRLFPDSPYGNTVTINGGDSDMDARGTIYSPRGEVTVNGGTGTITMDQIIAYVFKVNGNGGTLNALNDENFVATLTAAGLVE